MVEARPLAIIGCGARTPLGLDRVSSAAAVRAGVSAIDEHPYMIDRFGDPMKVTRDLFLPERALGEERMDELALAAAREALEPLAGRDVPPIPVILNVGEPRPGQTDGTARDVGKRLAGALQSTHPISTVTPIAEGHAGGLFALEQAAKAIREGRIEMALVGGVDSYLHHDTLEWLDDLEQLHSENNIYGFCPGEAAGFLLLTTPRMASQLHRRPLTTLVSEGSGQEKNLIKTDDIVLGEGLSDAFRATYEAAFGTEEKHIRPANRILCDMNGERYRGNEYGFAVLKNTAFFENAADFEAPADCWGDVGAATGPLLISLAIEASARGYSKGPVTLIWSSSEKGLRSAVLLLG
jgi:3-oxoacyl-[acyl-carrier-protein] synthase I